MLDFTKFWTRRRTQEFELIEEQHALMFNVVEHYFGALEAEDQLRFIQTEKQATQRQLEQIQKQFAKQLEKPPIFMRLKRTWIKFRVTR